MYRVSGKYMDKIFKKDLSQFMSGVKILIASSNRQDGISLEEGKKAMSFYVYKHYVMYCIMEKVKTSFLHMHF